MHLTVEIPSVRPSHLYFAYGSNLSPTQMKQRCKVNPALSATPVAIASLPAWRWLVCETGYANVLPPPSLRTGQQKKSPVRSSQPKDVVYGVLYEMDPGDEDRLDAYEGVDPTAESVRGHENVTGVEERGIDPAIRPREQGEGCYNKWYLSARVERWLGSEDLLRRRDGDQVPVLVYVNEEHVTPSPAKKEYIARMNRGIIEAGALGLSQDWVEEVVRPFILE